MRIQHNIMAMNAYRNYTNNVSAMQANLEKLSSGYRINRAGDDAAGLAISEKMRAQITGLETAQKNAKDGISLVQTAEGALTEVHDMLNRMVELASQSANGTYDNETDRYQLQKEMDQLRSEINRIADSSNFNGIKLLDGSMEAKTAIAGEKDLFASGALTVVSDGQLGNKEQPGIFRLDLTNFEATATSGTVKITVFGKAITIPSDVEGNTIAKDAKVDGATIASAIQDAYDTNGSLFDFTSKYGVKLQVETDGATVTFTMVDANGEEKAPTAKWDESSDVKYTGLDINYDTTGNGDSAVGNQANPMELSVVQDPVDSSAGRKYAQAQLDLSQMDIKDGTTLKIGDTMYTFAVGKGSEYKSGENVINLTDLTEDSIADNLGLVANRITTAALDNKNFKVTSVTALDQNMDNMIYLTEKEGGVDTEDYKLEGEPNADDSTDGDWTGLVTSGKIDPTANRGLKLQIGDTAESFNQLVVSISDCHADAMGIGSISIADQESAAKAIEAIKSAINYVSDVRGTLGATQNRLDHTINNLSVMTENIQDAESTIRDVDVAEEMMAYTKNNILIQSAQAMLAQANQVPQGVLQLLQ